MITTNTIANTHIQQKIYIKQNTHANNNYTNKTYKKQTNKTTTQPQL